MHAAEHSCLAVSEQAHALQHSYSEAPSRHWPKTVSSSSEREDHCPCLVPLADFCRQPSKGARPTTSAFDVLSSRTVSVQSSGSRALVQVLGNQYKMTDPRLTSAHSQRFVFCPVSLKSPTSSLQQGWDEGLLSSVGLCHPIADLGLLQASSLLLLQMAFSPRCGTEVGLRGGAHEDDGEEGGV